MRRKKEQVPQPTNSLTLSEAYRRLSRREGEVLEQIIVGKTNREIARVLFLNPKTVENHITKIGKKLNLSGNGRLREWAHAIGGKKMQIPPK